MGEPLHGRCCGCELERSTRFQFRSFPMLVALASYVSCPKWVLT